MTKLRITLGDYLAEEEPVAVLWSDLVELVYRDDPLQAHVERLSFSAKVLFDASCFSSEMINGGMSQFFSNSAGNRAHETLIALRTLGASLCVQLLEKGLSLFPAGIAPAERQKRCELVFAYEESDPHFLEDLDRIFYQRVDALGAIPEEDLAELKLAFMRAHSTDPVAA